MRVSLQESERGPLLQALMASLPEVPQMPKKPAVRLPSASGAASGSQQQSRVCSSPCILAALLTLTCTAR